MNILKIRKKAKEKLKENYWTRALATIPLITARLLIITSCLYLNDKVAFNLTTGVQTGIYDWSFNWLAIVLFGILWLTISLVTRPLIMDSIVNNISIKESLKTLNLYAGSSYRLTIRTWLLHLVGYIPVYGLVFLAFATALQAHYDVSNIMLISAIVVGTIIHYLIMYKTVLAPYMTIKMPMYAKDAVKESRKMLKGHYIQYLLLKLSFLPFNILNIFMAGFLSTHLYQYKTASYLTFLEEIKGETEQ